LTLVGEEGPELVNFRNPAMVYNNRDTADILGNKEMVEELRALRNEVIELRVQARRTADATNGNPEQPMLVETVA
jgi:aminoglycoside phosphotransferase (APT) family kinase protein